MLFSNDPVKNCLIQTIIKKKQVTFRGLLKILFVVDDHAEKTINEMVDRLYKWIELEVEDNADEVLRYWLK